MAKVIFTAWKNKSQLAEVRSEFYPSASYDGPDMRAHACAMVSLTMETSRMFQMLM